MIVRLWRGWTDAENTQAYRDLLTGQIAPAILDRKIPGLRDLTVLARDPHELDDDAQGETLTIMTFDDEAAIAEFTGGDHTASVVPAAARRLLTRFDEHSQHYVELARYSSDG